MPTLLLTARQTDDAQRLWRACIAGNWEVVRVHGWKVPSLHSNDLAIYGEPLFAQHVAREAGLHLIEPANDWLPNLAWRWRKRDVRLTTIGEARQLDRPQFIKPAAEKCFQAAVYSSGNEIPYENLPANLPVLVQTPVRWRIEFRCFVLESKVATLSPYWREGKLAKDEHGNWSSTEQELSAAKDFCEAVVSNVAAMDGVVVDVGQLEGGEWAVVEANAAWASGTYGCEPSAVLQTLLRACRRIP